MRTLLFLLALALLPAALQAADWVDQGDGTWTLSVTVTAPTTQAKDQLEQVRKHHNLFYRYAEDQLDPSAWLDGLLFGFQVTREIPGNPNPPPIFQLYRTLWQSFVNHWVPASSTDPLTDGLAVTVPAPPAQP